MKKSYWIKNISKVMLAVILVFIFMEIFASGVNYQENIINNTAYISMFEDEFKTDLEDSDGIINVLLIGTDDSKPGMDEDARADSITIVSANLKNKTIKMISVERSITVPIREIDSEDWITHVFRYSGAKGVVESVEDMFDIEIDRYVRVNFAAYKEVIDIMGGVEIDINAKEAEALQNIGVANGFLEIGTNKLNGDDALNYARLRSIDSNYERMDRQKNVLSAVLSTAKKSSVSDLVKIAIKVMPKLETNFTIQEVSSLLTNNYDMLTANIEQLTIPDKEDIVGGDHTEDGRILTKINVPIVKQKLHYCIYGVIIDVDPEEVAKYENYVSKYTAQEVWEADPHQDIDDMLPVDGIYDIYDHINLENAKQVDELEADVKTSEDQLEKTSDDNQFVDENGAIIRVPSLPKSEENSYNVDKLPRKGEDTEVQEETKSAANREIE